MQTLNEVPYNNWRDYDPDNSFRFYALRMRELGFIKSTPQKIIAEGTDWRFLNELKRELKVSAKHRSWFNVENADTTPLPDLASAGRRRGTSPRFALPGGGGAA